MASSSAFSSARRLSQWSSQEDNWRKSIEGDSDDSLRRECGVWEVVAAIVSSCDCFITTLPWKL